jgi:molecular chaperone Hsp33
VRYLVDSEQSPAAVVLGDVMLPTGSVGQAGGLLLQVLPGVSDAEAAELEARILAMGPLSSCLEAGEPPMQWMGRLFPDGFLTLETKPVRFVCGCSRDRVERALLLLGPDEIRGLLRDGGTGSQEMTCGFCRTSYEVSRDDLTRLLMEAERPGDPPPDA